MDAMKAILSRRSIRKYTGEPVSDEDLKQILEAAMAAPSACNQQPWHFIVVKDPEILAKIPKVQPYTRMVESAGMAIIVCAEPSLETCKGFWEQDTTAATMNILHAVNALGLGACWCGIHPNMKPVNGIRELLGIPDSVIPLNVIAVGHPDEEKAPADRFKKERVHLDKW